MSRIQLTCEFINISEERTRDNFSPQIYHDEQRIQQVLLNFQSNALKYTKGGKVNIKVKIERNEENKLESILTVSVEDNGSGIKKEDQPKLFKLFGVLKDEQNANPKGIGLGLVISK